MTRTLIPVIVLFIFLNARVAESDNSQGIYTDGVFQISLPSDFSQITGARLSGLRKQMIGGAQDLSEESGLIDQNDINSLNKKWLSFFSAFDNPAKKLMVILMGMQIPVTMSYDELYKGNKQKIEWGIKTGQLSKNTKGVSKLTINNVPTLLMDIETSGGSRSQFYSFSISKYPKHTFQVSIACYHHACNKELEEKADDIINSVKIMFPKD